MTKTKIKGDKPFAPRILESVHKVWMTVFKNALEESRQASGNIFLLAERAVQEEARERLSSSTRESSVVDAVLAAIKSVSAEYKERFLFQSVIDEAPLPDIGEEALSDMDESILRDLAVINLPAMDKATLRYMEKIILPDIGEIIKQVAHKSAAALGLDVEEPKLKIVTKKTGPNQKAEIENIFDSAFPEWISAFNKYRARGESFVEAAEDASDVLRDHLKEAPLDVQRKIMDAVDGSLDKLISVYSDKIMEIPRNHDVLVGGFAGAVHEEVADKMGIKEMIPEPSVKGRLRVSGTCTL